MKNREFKFRVWDLEKGCWLNNAMGSSLFLFLQGAKGTYAGAEDKVVPQQFTGLLDKNEKEIYEGDLVNFESNYYGGEIAVVSFYNSMFILYPTIHLKDTMTFFMNVDYKNIILDHRVCRNCKIIGNTTENPELIK